MTVLTPRTTPGRSAAPADHLEAAIAAFGITAHTAIARIGAEG